MDPVGGLIGLGILIAFSLFIVIFGDTKKPINSTRKN